MKTLNLNYISKILGLFIAILIGFVTISCSSDDSDDGDNPVLGCNELTTLSTEYLEAFETFQSNATEATCNSFRTAALDLIDAIGNCNEFAEQYSELEEAAQNWTELDCSQEFD